MADTTDKKKKTHKRKEGGDSAKSPLRSSAGETDIQAANLSRRPSVNPTSSTIHLMPPPEKVVFPIAISVQLSFNIDNNVTHISIVGDNSVAFKLHSDLFSAATGLGGLQPVFHFNNGYSVDVPPNVGGDEFLLSKARAISGLVDKLLSTNYDLKHIDSTNNKTLLVFLKS